MMKWFSRFFGSGASAGDRRKAMVSTGIGVVILALVIVGAAALAPWKSDQPTVPASPIADDPASRSDQLLQQADQAAQSGDTTKALDLAKKAVGANPQNTRAKNLVDQLQSLNNNTNSNDSNGSNGTTKPPGPSKKPGPSKTPTDTASPDDGFTTPISNLAVLLPVRFDGYSLYSPTSTQRDVSVSAAPTNQGGTASRIIWTVRDFGSNNAAKSFITGTSSSVYGSDKATVNVDGVSAYFGTDGVRFATVAYTRGRFVFELLVTANDGVQPSSLRPLSTDAARAFADRRP